MTFQDTWDPPIGDVLATAGSPWLTDKVAMVAGGGLSGPLGNIGFAMAWLYHRNGARVAVLDRDPEAGRRTVEAITADGGNAAWFAADLTDDASCAGVVGHVCEHFGRVDVVASSIGGGGARDIFDIELADWDAAMDLNLKSAWLLMRNVEPRLPRGGSIVTISSGAVDGRGPGMPYSIAKTGLEKLTTGAASSLASRGIRANCVRVGMIWGAFAARGMTEQQREQRRRNVALQTEGTVWDIASAALFLSTDQARWISGQVLPVDGGGFAARNTGAAGSGTGKGSRPAGN